MFFILFGLIWLGTAALFTWVFYFSGAEISVNGQMVTQAEFNLILWPKLFMGLFCLIGIIFLAKGMKNIIKNKNTDRKGEECFGRLLKVYDDSSELKADFVVYIPSENSVKVISEVVRINENNLPIGAFFILKYYNGDINVLTRFDEEAIPLNILEIINSEYDERSNDNNIIEINGEKYMKIDN